MALTTLNLYRIKYLASGEKERIFADTITIDRVGYRYFRDIGLTGEGIEIDVDVEVDPRLYKASCIIRSKENYKDTAVEKDIRRHINFLLKFEVRNKDFTWEPELSELDKNKRSIESYYLRKGWIDDSELPLITEVKEEHKNCTNNKQTSFWFQ